MDNTNEIADEMSEGRDVGGAVPYMVCENINVVGDTHIVDVCCTDNARLVRRPEVAPTDLLP